MTSENEFDISGLEKSIKENGFIIVPKSSIGAKINFIGVGTPGIQNICPQ